MAYNRTVWQDGNRYGAESFNNIEEGILELERRLDEGDLVRARTVAISLKDNSVKDTKIGLTMRQNNLGRFEWIEEAKQKSKKA